MIKSSFTAQVKPSFISRVREALLARALPAPVFVRRNYERHTGKKLNLKNPQTFNEKIQWLKLYNRDPKLTELVDKYRVKEFVSQTVGSEYVLPTSGLFERAEDIKLSELPEKCILKATHGSAWNVIIKDKGRVSEREIQKFFRKRLRSNYYSYSKEWPYKGVIPRVLCEELLLDEHGETARDHKIFCFNGSPKFMAIDYDKFNSPKRALVDRHGNLKEFSVGYPPYSGVVNIPDCTESLFLIAEKLSYLAPFVRIDFLVHDGRPYIGEITFYPGNGKDRFFPCSADALLGEMLKIDKVRI
jgi:hypothetical protein